MPRTPFRTPLEELIVTSGDTIDFHDGTRVRGTLDYASNDIRLQTFTAAGAAAGTLTVDAAASPFVSWTGSMSLNHALAQMYVGNNGGSSDILQRKATGGENRFHMQVANVSRFQIVQAATSQDIQFVQRDGASALLATTLYEQSGNWTFPADVALGTGDASSRTIAVVANAGGNGGALVINAGAGSADGGLLTLRGGSATDGNGGGVDLLGRTGVGVDRDGGPVQLSGGTATGTGLGGSVIATAGDAGSGTGTAGGVTLTGGSGSGVSAGGDVLLRGGVAGTTGDGGGVSLFGRNGGATSGDGGDVVLTAGNATNGTAGSIVLTPGVAVVGTDGTVDVVGDLTVSGKLTVTGMIDPPGLQMTESAANPGTVAPGNGTIWIRDDTPNVLVFTDDGGDDFEVAMRSRSWSLQLTVGNVARDNTYTPAGGGPGSPGTQAENLNTRIQYLIWPDDTENPNGNVWECHLPTAYAGGGLTCAISFTGSGAAEAAADIRGSIEGYGATANVNTVAFASEVAATGNTPSATEWVVTTATISWSSVEVSGAGVVAGQPFRIALYRQDNDAYTGEVRFLSALVEEA